jgi:hypothetical protein
VRRDVMGVAGRGTGYLKERTGFGMRSYDTSRLTGLARTGKLRSANLILNSTNNLLRGAEGLSCSRSAEH